MALTTTYRLYRAFLNLASDPSQYVSVGTNGRTENIQQEGAFRQYANFRVRLIQGTGRTRILASITLTACDAAQVAKLKNWVGQTVLFRDTYGRKFYGSYLTPAIVDIPLSGRAKTTSLANVTIDFQETTYTEAVDSQNPYH